MSLLTAGLALLGECRELYGHTYWFSIPYQTQTKMGATYQDLRVTFILSHWFPCGFPTSRVLQRARLQSSTLRLPLSLVSQCIFFFPPGWCPFGVLGSFPAKNPWVPYVNGSTCPPDLCIQGIRFMTPYIITGLLQGDLLSPPRNLKWPA